MHPFSKISCLIALVLTLVFSGATSSFAHLPITTNMAIDIELNDRLLVIEPWIPTFLLPPLEDVTFENPDEWPNAEARRAQIEAHFDQICPIVIDGVHTKPKLQKLALQPMEQAKHLGEIIDFVEARIVLHYEAANPPERINFRWGIYPPEPAGGWGDLVDADQNPQEFDMLMFVDKKEDFILFSPQEPEFLWNRKPKEVTSLNVMTPEESAGAGNVAAGAEAAPYAPRLRIAALVALLLGTLFYVGASRARSKLPIRVIPLSVVGLAAFYLQEHFPPAPTASAGLTESQAVETFKKLQANLYSAFDFETEDQVYDVLEQSVDGALLDDIYTEVYRSLIVEDKSRALCKVHQVDVLESAATAIDAGPDGRAERFDIACHWRVHGIVQHHAHIHRRVNEYRADYRLTHKENGWRITGVAVAQQDRLDPKTLKKSVDY